ncbi:MAG: helix-turn-helix transcriptional regulator [Gammaproteobacteria bacterium]|nr:helix-turn-helix transcriptional regulator [Gammaproteobacteria bacterium]MDH5728264.1 helix-turn-helix transcriptional regulator [Gammaproteobacteria bacterium]
MNKKRSSCPVTNSLDILGDKWTLIVVRDLLLRRQASYSELCQSPEQIPTNILSDRLKRLEKHKIVQRDLYQNKPKRYHYRLTDKGEDLKPVMLALVKWGLKHLKGTEILLSNTDKIKS